ncbi:DUF6789 family protein [Herbidospora daliensis]|uniref:DUF6789 family protein n=1 Tax=Herbidospora daliensis TaxID=295585 RepID=UPI000782EEC0|nr:DUF6789 family protein [Herbidospora daliensis]
MVRELGAGVVGGLVATAAMSAVMLAGRRMGLMDDHPPKHIVRTLLPGSRHRPKPGEKTLGVLSHFGFGAAAGGVFAAAARGHRTPAPVGAAYGLAVWLAGYQGWVPALGALPPASRDDQGRQFVMAAAHVVYGTTLACTLNRLT